LLRLSMSLTSEREPVRYLVLSASLQNGSLSAGNRRLWALLAPPEPLPARIYPDMFSLAQAHRAFDDEGRIESEQLRERFEGTITGFMDLAEASAHNPCLESAWVECLGERPEPATEHAQ